MTTGFSEANTSLTKASTAADIAAASALASFVVAKPLRPNASATISISFSGFRSGVAAS